MTNLGEFLDNQREKRRLRIENDKPNGDEEIKICPACSSKMLVSVDTSDGPPEYAVASCEACGTESEWTVTWWYEWQIDEEGKILNY